MADARSAVAHLRAGGLVVFPTDTVWGLACLATDARAADRIREVKDRPADLPLAVAFASWDEATPFIDASPGAAALARRFLPGAVSLVLRRRDARLAHLAPGHDTLSVRVPDHPMALAILRGAGPLALTSANRHGEPDALDMASAQAAVDGQGDIVVVDWREPVGDVPSTVVDATGGRPKVLRQGLIPLADIQAAWSASSS